MINPFSVFQSDEQHEELVLEPKNIEQGSAFTVDYAGEFKIKNRKIKHKRNFGRGANHPSFFLRKFFSKLPIKQYQAIYNQYPTILEYILNKGNRLRTSKKRFNLDDLKDIFGDSQNEEKRIEKYLNSKMFFKAISQNSLQMIMQESKCSQVLNHLISIQKYSSRLGNSLLIGRVQFQ